MISIDPIRPYLPLIKAGLLALLVASIWGHGCSYGRKDLAEAKAKHAATLEGLAKATKAQARRAKEVEEGVRLMRREAEKAYQKGIEDAFTRGAATAADIASGKLPVGGVWRDQCPKAPAGQGAGPDAGSTGISADRAQAIGRVLTIGGEADATDALLRSRLQEAQQLLNACYDQPADRPVSGN